MKPPSISPRTKIRAVSHTCMGTKKRSMVEVRRDKASIASGVASAFKLLNPAIMRQTHPLGFSIREPLWPFTFFLGFRGASTCRKGFVHSAGGSSIPSPPGPTPSALYPERRNPPEVMGGVACADMLIFRHVSFIHMWTYMNKSKKQEKIVSSRLPSLIPHECPSLIGRRSLSLQHP